MAGFFKKNEDEIVMAENFVYSPIVTLKIEEKDNYTYPQDGWYYFDTKEEAEEFFNNN